MAVSGSSSPNCSGPDLVASQLAMSRGAEMLVVWCPLWASLFKKTITFFLSKPKETTVENETVGFSS